MKTLAPELSALMTIFASAGPVISTRRSSRSCGVARHRPLGLAQLARLLGEGRALAGGESLLALLARPQQSAPARAEAALEVADEAAAPRGRAARPGRERAARRPRRSCRPPAVSAGGERAQRLGAAAQERRAVRDEDALGAPRARRSSALRSPMPPYHQRSAALRPYQPGGHSAQRRRRRSPSMPSPPSTTSPGTSARIVAQDVGGLADRVAQGNRRAPSGHDTVERRVAGDHLVRPAPVPVHGDDDADLAAEALHVAVERAPEAGCVVGVLGHDRVDQQERAGQLAVDAADLLDPAARARRNRAATRDAARSSATVRSRSPAPPGPPRTAANRPAPRVSSGAG